MAARIIAVEGPSAAGKTRAVSTVARHLGGAPLAEAYDRVTPRPSLDWARPAELLRLEQRLFAEDARRFREARDLAEAEGFVIADTGFLGTLTYTWGLVRVGAAPGSLLRALVRTARTEGKVARWGLPDAVLYLRTPASERDRRSQNDAVGHPVEHRARHQRVAVEERRFYQNVLAPAYGPRFRFVSGRGRPAEVVGRLVRAAERVAAAPGGAPPLGPILRSLERPEGVA